MSDKTTAFVVTVNDSKELEIQPSSIEQLDTIQDGIDCYHIIEQNKSYKTEVINADFEKKMFLIKVNGNVHSVKISDKYDRLVKEIGLTIGQGQKANNVKSPMPGLVLSINVAVGDVLTKGDTILILEAMKMENLIKATSDVTIKSISVTQGQAVVKGKLLVEFE